MNVIFIFHIELRDSIRNQLEPTQSFYVKKKSCIFTGNAYICIFGRYPVQMSARTLLCLSCHHHHHLHCQLFRD